MDKALLNRLYRYAISLTGDGDEAYDLLQQAMERYLKRPQMPIAKEKPIDNPSAYLMRIIRNLFFDQVRHQRLHLIVTEQLKQEQPSATECPSLTDILIDQQDIEQLMDGLNSMERELLYLWAVEEYTAQEIADMHECPRGTILSQLHRLKKKLREKTSRQYEVSSL